MVCKSDGYRYHAFLTDFRRFALIRYSTLRGKWEDDLIFSFQSLHKPTSYKNNVIFMEIWEEGIVSKISAWWDIIIMC